MNNSNELIFLILLAVSFLLIGVLSGAVVYLYLKSKNNSGENNKPESIKPKLESLSTEHSYCENHSNEASKGSCAICEKGFCEACLRDWEGVNFCPEHLKLVSENKWVGITNIKTTPSDPEAAMYIYNFKKEQWKTNKTPSYIVTHYKINFEGDHIESYVMLYVRSQDEEYLKNKIVKIN
ncbi:MAG: hypothetical protein ACJAT2_002432 [Bacteriovoracaceae bacterium]|jgi:hypothetical protein